MFIAASLRGGRVATGNIAAGNKRDWDGGLCMHLSCCVFMAFIK